MYLFFKYIHIISVIGWASSTSSLGLYLLYKTLVSKDLSNQKELRDFYRVLTFFELLFFTLIVICGLGMVFSGKLSLENTWLKYKMLTVFGFFLPLEIINGVLIFKFVKNERWYRIYDKFVLTISIPLIAVGLFVIYLAVFKP